MRRQFPAFLEAPYELYLHHPIFTQIRSSLVNMSDNLFTLHFPYDETPPPFDRTPHAIENMTKRCVLESVGICDPEGPHKCDLFVAIKSGIALGPHGMVVYRTDVCPIC